MARITLSYFFVRTLSQIKPSHLANSQAMHVYRTQKKKTREAKKEEFDKYDDLYFQFTAFCLLNL